MIHHHWLSIVGTIVFVVSACAILTFSTATFAAIWVGVGAAHPRAPARPRHRGGPRRPRVAPDPRSALPLFGTALVRDCWTRATLRPCRTPTRGRAPTRGGCAATTSRCSGRCRCGGTTTTPTATSTTPCTTCSSTPPSTAGSSRPPAPTSGAARDRRRRGDRPAGTWRSCGSRRRSPPGVALGRLGRSSVTYRLALFGERADGPAAVGRFVHVYVDAASRRPVPVPRVRAASPASTRPWRSRAVTAHETSSPTARRS